MRVCNFFFKWDILVSVADSPETETVLPLLSDLPNVLTNVPTHDLEIKCHLERKPWNEGGRWAHLEPTSYFLTSCPPFFFFCIFCIFLL